MKLASIPLYVQKMFMKALSNFDIIFYGEPKNSPVATRLVGFLQFHPFFLKSEDRI